MLQIARHARRLLPADGPLPARPAATAATYRLAHLFKSTLPAIMQQLVTALRVAIGVARMVVAAERIAVRSGVGFSIVGARNGLRMDLVVCGTIVVGSIGVALDALFARLAKTPGVRWGFAR